MSITRKNNTTKVLIIGQHYWPETFRISDIAEGLVERGYEVEVLCGTPNYPVGKFFNGYGFFKRKREIHNGVKIIRVPEIPRGDNSNLRIFINYISFPLFSLLYVPFFLFKRYDRVIAYQLSPVFMSLPAIILAKLKRKPLFFYVGDFWPHSLFSMLTIKSRLVRKIITNISYWHYRRADGVIGVFKGMQDRFISDVGITKEKTLYIPQAPEKIYESRAVSNEITERFKDTFNIVFAGNINPAQCFDVITQAAQRVKKRGYKNVRYIIIGEGMSKKWLEKRVKDLGVDDQFIFEGLKPVEEVPKYQAVASATIVALSKSPLFEYGIPAKVYSYLPAGKPVVAAIDGEGQNLINNLAKCGICVDSGDYKGMADAIEKLINAPEKSIKKMGDNGFNYYLRHFERESNLDRLEQFVIHNNRIPDAEYPDK